MNKTDLLVASSKAFSCSSTSFLSFCFFSSLIFSNLLLKHLSQSLLVFIDVSIPQHSEFNTRSSLVDLTNRSFSCLLGLSR